MNRRVLVTLIVLLTLVVPAAAWPADPHEPNNTIEQATPLTVGAAIRGELAEPVGGAAPGGGLDTDLFKFSTVQENQAVFFDFTYWSGASGPLSLCPNGSCYIRATLTDLDGRRGSDGFGPQVEFSEVILDSAARVPTRAADGRLIGWIGFTIQKAGEYLLRLQPYHQGLPTRRTLAPLVNYTVTFTLGSGGPLPQSTTPTPPCCKPILTRACFRALDARRGAYKREHAARRAYRRQRTRARKLTWQKAYRHWKQAHQQAARACE